MRYRPSEIDRKNFAWMASDNSCQTLAKVALLEGTIRCLSPFTLSFNYPISAIAGGNGSGKSTILALIACAFHNKGDAHTFTTTKYAYYTYGDFFIQAKDDSKIENIIIRYGIRNDRWHKAEPGLRFQTHKKNAGGKWSSYKRRVRRNVVFFGTYRIVPPYERSQHKTYRSYFKALDDNATIFEQVRKTASKILSKDYSNYADLRYGKYVLPRVHSNGSTYTGFNMGAGEFSVFNILTAIYSLKKGSLIVIDEIELGLHEQAQRRFIKELKIICEKLHCQIVCSTHSSAILDEIPPEGRFLIKQEGENIEILNSISSKYASGTLSGSNTNELDIFVEDEVAKHNVTNILKQNIRKRVKIKPIGSDEVNLRLMASRYIEERKLCITILDGDKSTSLESFLNKVVNYTGLSDDEEKTICKKWVLKRLLFLPGSTWPEKYLLDTVLRTEQTSQLADDLQIEESELRGFVEESLRAGKHSEFYRLGMLCELPEEQTLTSVIKFLDRNDSTLFEPIRLQIQTVLE